MGYANNGFIKLKSGEWLNLNSVIRFSVENFEKSKHYILVHYLEGRDVYQQIVGEESYKTAERAFINLDQLIQSLEKA